MCITENIPKLANFVLTMNQKWCIIYTQDTPKNKYSLFFVNSEPYMVYLKKGVIELEEVINFIKPELLILIPVLYFTGLGIKKSNVPDENIPLLLGIISILLSTLWVLSTSEIGNWQDVVSAVFVSITQGVLAAGATVYASQLFIQFKKK